MKTFSRDEYIDISCFSVNWCASGPCLNNGTCTVNQQLGRYQCNCLDGWSGVQCAYRKFDWFDYGCFREECF